MVGPPDLALMGDINVSWFILSTDKTIRFLDEEIANYAKDKQLWNLSIATHKLPAQ